MQMKATELDEEEASKIAMYFEMVSKERKNLRGRIP